MLRPMGLSALLLCVPLQGNPPDSPTPSPAPEADWSHGLEAGGTLLITTTGYRCALGSGILLEGGRGQAPRGGNAPGQASMVRTIRQWAEEKGRVEPPSIRREHLLAFLHDTRWAVPEEPKAPSRKRKAVEDLPAPAPKRPAMDSDVRTRPRAVPGQVDLAALLSEELPVVHEKVEGALGLASHAMNAACGALARALADLGQPEPWLAMTGKRPHDLAVGRYQATAMARRLLGALQAAGKPSDVRALPEGVLACLETADELLTLLLGESLPLEAEPSAAPEARP